jgi:hypothetical protein
MNPVGDRSEQAAAALSRLCVLALARPNLRQFAHQRGIHVARTYVAVIKDDLTGEVVDQEDAESIEFAVNGKSYMIDLGKENAAEFYKSLDKYIAVATRVAGTSSHKPARGSKKDLAAIREWGKENGFKVSARGRVSSELKGAYSNAH